MTQRENNTKKGKLDKHDSLEEKQDKEEVKKSKRRKKRRKRKDVMQEEGREKYTQKVGRRGKEAE